MRKAFAALLLLAAAGTSPAGVNFPLRDRVPNEPPGYCVWACVETLGRRQGVRPLYGLLASRKEMAARYAGPVEHVSGGNFRSIREQFGRLNFTAYRMVQDRRGGWPLVEAAVRTGRGCMVGVTMDNGEGHVVVVTDADERFVRYIDLNPGTLRREYLWDTRESFLRAFDGLVLVLD